VIDNGKSWVKSKLILLRSEQVQIDQTWLLRQRKDFHKTITY